MRATLTTRYCDGTSGAALMVVSFTTKLTKNLRFCMARRLSCRKRWRAIPFTPLYLSLAGGEIGLIIEP